MGKTIIPIRPKEDNFTIPKTDKDILTYQVLFGCDNQTAYLRFHPEFMDGDKLNKAGKTACRQFFSYARNKEYQDAYRSTLAEASLGGGVQDFEEEISDERKNRALQRLLHQAMKKVESGVELDMEELKTVSDIFKKVGLLKDENGERIEAPRRYLPERCSACRYKLFIEEQIELGNIIEEKDV